MHGSGLETDSCVGQGTQMINSVKTVDTVTHYTELH